MNRSLVIFSIAISLLSVVFMFLQYMGYVRYCQLCMNSSESYAEAYKGTPRAEYKGKIVVSISPSTTDLNDIKPFLNSILDQTVHTDQIAINLHDKTNYVIPDFIKNTDLISIYKVPENYYDAAKLIAPLLREKNGDCLLILLNDQVVYGKDFIESVVEEVNKSPNSAICCSVNGKLIDTSMGVAVKPNFLPADTIDALKGPIDVCKDFDVFVSANLAKKKTPVKAINYKDNLKRQKENVNESRRDRLMSFFAAYF